MAQGPDTKLQYQAPPLHLTCEVGSTLVVSFRVNDANGAPVATSSHTLHGLVKDAPGQTDDEAVGEFADYTWDDSSPYTVTAYLHRSVTTTLTAGEKYYWAIASEYTPAGVAEAVFTPLVWGTLTMTVPVVETMPEGD